MENQRLTRDFDPRRKQSSANKRVAPRQLIVVEPSGTDILPPRHDLRIVAGTWDLFQPEVLAGNLQSIRPVTCRWRYNRGRQLLQLYRANVGSGDQPTARLELAQSAIRF